MPDKSTGSTVASPQKKYPLPKIVKPKALAGTVYRGNVGMWSWVLHRITGVAIFFFLLVHILDSTLLRVSPEAYNAVIGTYKNPIMGLGEVVLVAAIGIHALNGLRVILVDFWAWGMKHQKLLQWIGLALWIILLIGFVPRHLINVFSE
ncbi:MAG: succinate dehydrogenase, cytochrome b556 subunit [Cryobacterium sp.]|nr:succinate dehydrogenase, cytochrome b556 subunit [Cryobacterium sp.]MBX3104469.1 succinate dehydrogenase, cytochrome b556 subunit [Cryobacterium sp.]